MPNNQVASASDESDKAVLAYPFRKAWRPEIGEPFEVAEGVYWLRMPLPMSLDHINLWLLKDGDQWVIVDTGLELDTCKAVWENVFQKFLSPHSVSRVLVTHFHPDHSGLASWLAVRCDCQVWITEKEFAYYTDIVNRDPVAYRKAVDEKILQTGYAAEVAEKYFKIFSSDADKQRLQAEQCRFLSKDDVLEINDRQWLVVTGNGHSPDHACLFCEEMDILISGDQVLPRISSNVSVHVKGVADNPLLDWLASCVRLQQTISPSAMILPAHQEPFIGIDIRMQQLIDGHQADLDKLRDMVRQRASAKTICEQLFNRELNAVHRMLALGETLAHINYLLFRDEISATVKDGVIYYTEVASL